MLRLSAAAALIVALTTSALAQTETPAVTPETAPVVAPAADSVAPATPEAAAPAIAAVPTDPMELVALARTRAQEGERCRYAFTRQISTVAQVMWSASDIETAIRFDPRRPVGERYTVLHASSQQRALERALVREDRKALPYDLIGLMPEGEWTYENIAVAEELPDRIAYSYAPRIIPTREGSETGTGIIQQLVGRVEVSRETGHILNSALREPTDTAVRALGIVRVRRALVRSVFTEGPNGLLAETGSQMFSMSALVTPTETTTSFRFVDIEPICGAEEVAAIAAAEAAALQGSRRR